MNPFSHDYEENCRKEKSIRMINNQRYKLTTLLHNTCNYHKGCFYGIVSPHYFFPVLISRIMNLWAEYLWYVQTVFYRPVWFPFRVVKWYLLAVTFPRRAEVKYLCHLFGRVQSCKSFWHSLIEKSNYSQWK